MLLVDFVYNIPFLIFFPNIKGNWTWWWHV